MKRRTFFSAAAVGSASVLALEGCSAPIKRSITPDPKYIRKDAVNTKATPIVIATCQFPISSDITLNCAAILRQMRLTKKNGADIAHFSETALGGYAGVDFKSFDGYDWDVHSESMRRIQALAKELSLWIILGSNHRLTDNHKPHNCLYVIDGSGNILDRYDKMFCTGNQEETSGDLKHYSPGTRFVVFEINGIHCGLQICHDMRYPEMYREYKKLGVTLMFHSYYNGKRSFKNADDPDENIWGVITEPTMQTYAAVNNMYISVNNTATVESCWPSFFVRPDGVITGRLDRNAESILISTVDTRYSFYDASQTWRDRAMNGIFHSGTPVDDPRSDNRTAV